MTESELFDAALRRRAPELGVRPETEGDEQFLTELYIACSPLAAVLPRELLEQQASIQRASHRQQHPDSMRRIVLRGDVPVGRIAVDWDMRGVAYGIDIAVLPAARRTLAGPHMLRAWLEVADALRLACTLDVVAANPARCLYRRLGFVEAAGLGPAEPIVAMERRI